MAGRATGEQHVKRKDEKKISTFSMDYLYCTKSRVVSRGELEEGEEVELKALVAKDSRSKTVFAHAVEVKGADDAGYAVSRMVEDIAWLGHTKIILKSDNEPAIVKVLKDSLKTARVEIEELEQVQEEQAVRYDSKSNGDVENAVKQVTGLLRTLKLCLEKRIGMKIPSSHPIISWLIEHTAWLLNTRMVGADGVTAYHRTKGRSYAKRSVGFGIHHAYASHKRSSEGGTCNAGRKVGLWIRFGL